MRGTKSQVTSVTRIRLFVPSMNCRGEVSSPYTDSDNLGGTESRRRCREATDNQGTTRQQRRRSEHGPPRRTKTVVRHSDNRNCMIIYVHRWRIHCEERSARIPIDRHVYVS